MKENIDIKEITSVNNQIVKDTVRLHQKKYRNETGYFLIEGKKCVEEALLSNLELTSVFIQQGVDFEPLENVEVFEVTEPVMKKLSTTETPPEIVAIGKQKQFSLKDFFREKSSLILVLEDIKDAGNLGTIIRTSSAFDVSGIILVGDTVDIYNPKTIRSAVGNLWKVPIIQLKEKENIKKNINNYKKCTFFAAVVSKKAQYVYNSELKGDCVIMLGSEADGLSKILLEQADCDVNIPISNNVESLNLSVSAGVILYESFRQRLSGQS